MENAEGEEVTFNGLAEAVRYWGEWIKQKTEEELAEFYPHDPDGATPIAYLWARTVTCEGPECGAKVPLMRSLWLSRRKGRRVGLRMVVDSDTRQIDFEIIEDPKTDAIQDGTVSRGNATCPACGYTTPVSSVRRQLSSRKGGTEDARLIAVVSSRPEETGRFYRLPEKADTASVEHAAEVLRRRASDESSTIKDLIPNEATPEGGGSGAGRAFSQRNYGMDRFSDLFTPRALLALTTLVCLVRRVQEQSCDCQDVTRAVTALLALAVSRQADKLSSLARWDTSRENAQGTFARQALPMVWDFCEPYPSSGCGGDFGNALDWILRVCEANAEADMAPGIAQAGDARRHPLPDRSADCYFTDPPYYDAVPYADLSDFFIVWLRRMIGELLDGLSLGADDYKCPELIVDDATGKTHDYYEEGMSKAFAEGRRILAPDAIGSVIFAHKSTEGWEALLEAVVEAGWVITASWPIDTEMGSRLRAMGSAALASSVHLVLRPRENASGELIEDRVGNWHEVNAELPVQVREWLFQLTDEGIVGADAIFACLGPALEIYSQYSRVERASGEVVSLREYLEHVWATVSREALGMIFESADASGFEEDARLTAMWLWTLSTGDTTNGNSNGAMIRSTGYELEFDAARKISQGLGAHLEELPSVVEVKGETGRLLPVRERAQYLFQDVDADEPISNERKPDQRALFDILDEVDQQEESWERSFTALGGETTLDRVHQAMLLFTSGRQAALKRFLKEDGHGKSDRFWRLAQALSALYPRNTDEKRWVDGVLSQKKGLGL